MIELVRRSPVEKKQTLGSWDWRLQTTIAGSGGCRDEGEAGLVDRRPQPGTVWNRMRSQKKNRSFWERPCASRTRTPREVACWLSDHAGFAVSESSVYRVLKRHGLIREVKVLGFPAGRSMASDHASERTVAE